MKQNLVRRSVKLMTGDYSSRQPNTTDSPRRMGVLSLGTHGKCAVDFPWGCGRSDD